MLVGMHPNGDDTCSSRFHHPRPLMFKFIRTTILHFLGEACILASKLAFEIVELLWGIITREHAASITTEQLHQILCNDPQSIILIDVRSDEERQVSMLPHAISLDEFKESEVSSSHASSTRERLIIPYCTLGGRSFRETRKLLRQGRGVSNYREGIIGWTRANLPLVTPDGVPTKRIHRYWAWLSVPESYEAVP